MKAAEVSGLLNVSPGKALAGTSPTKTGFKKSGAPAGYVDYEVEILPETNDDGQLGGSTGSGSTQKPQQFNPLLGLFTQYQAPYGNTTSIGAGIGGQPPTGGHGSQFVHQPMFHTPQYVFFQPNQFMSASNQPANPVTSPPFAQMLAAGNNGFPAGPRVVYDIIPENSNQTTPVSIGFPNVQNTPMSNGFSAGYPGRLVLGANGKGPQLLNQVLQNGKTVVGGPTTTPNDGDNKPYKRPRKRRKASNCTSRYRGVSWHQRDQRWVGRAWVNGKTRNAGTFLCERLAAVAVDRKLIEHHGPDATYLLNFKTEAERQAIEEEERKLNRKVPLPPQHIVDGPKRHKTGSASDDGASSSNDEEGKSGSENEHDETEGAGKKIELAPEPQETVTNENDKNHQEQTITEDK